MFEYTSEERKRIEALTKKLDKYRSLNDYTWIHHYEDKIARIRTEAHWRDERPNMGLPDEDD